MDQLCLIRLICIWSGFTGASTTYNVECFDEKTCEWYEATDMNIFRSALSACVISGLPNMHDYIHQHRDRLMEEKRQKMLTSMQPVAAPHPPQSAAAVIGQNPGQTQL